MLGYKWEGWAARPNQLPPPGQWVIWLVLAGRGFGKTRIGAEWVRGSVKHFELVNLIAATADDARDIMIEGESGIMAICPPWERPEYQPSKRRLVWPNGAKSLVFTADEPERLRGKQHMRVWADEIAAWRYPEAWDQALLGLRLGTDPKIVATTTPKPTRMIRQLVVDPTCVTTRGTTYDNLMNLAPAFAAEIIKRYEGTRLGRQELNAELLEDEGMAYPMFTEQTHVVAPFVVPDEWDRFESMDFGINNPTAWHVWAADHDGNLVVFDEYYSPGIVTDHATAVRKLRERWWSNREDGWGRKPVCHADPSIRSRTGGQSLLGDPATIQTEFADHGISLSAANNDPRAGMLRLLELLRVETGRVRPSWAQLDAAQQETAGAPRLYITENCGHLIEQLREAPLRPPDEPHAGEMVDPKWESAHGHAHASLRYGAMSRQSPSERPPEVIEDPREAHARKWLEQKGQASAWRDI